MTENLFRWKGVSQHEVVFVYSAGLTDLVAYEITEQRVLDNTRVIWRPRVTARPPLYPDGVEGMLALMSEFM